MNFFLGKIPQPNWWREHEENGAQVTVLHVFKQTCKGSQLDWEGRKISFLQVEIEGHLNQ